jgi:hypothetical protein
MPTDFSDYTGLIPAGTIALLQTQVRPGDGVDGILKRTRNGDAQGLDFVLALLDTPHAKSKLFWFALVEGETDGQKSVIERNFGMLKKIIDSAKFLDPNDRSPEARAKRTVNWRDFNNVIFLGEIGIEEGKDGFPDKNILAKVITRDMPQWNGRPPIEQITDATGAPQTPASSAAPQAPAPIPKPPWA